MTLAELLQRYGALTETRLERWIACGLVRPTGAPAAWQFTTIDVARVELLLELRDDLAIDDEALESIISLLDQVHGLRRRIELLARAIERQPSAVREAIVAELRALGEQ